jgi:serine/threonine-protein kinase
MAKGTDESGRLLGGRYQLQRRLGEGGMGAVYQAWQDDLQRSVAVKVLHEVDEQSLERFRREARAAAALGSPHIIAVLDFQTPVNEPPFLVMELLRGQTLFDAIHSQGPLEAARAARIGIQVLSALEAAHTAGILHRDIKPANIFLSESPTLGEIAKVLDFGIAKLSGGRSLTSTR